MWSRLSMNHEPRCRVGCSRGPRVWYCQLPREPEAWGRFVVADPLCELAHLTCPAFCVINCIRKEVKKNESEDKCKGRGNWVGPTLVGMVRIELTLAALRIGAAGNPGAILDGGFLPERGP